MKIQRKKRVLWLVALLFLILIMISLSIIAQDSTDTQNLPPSQDSCVNSRQIDACLYMINFSLQLIKLRNDKVPRIQSIISKLPESFSSERQVLSNKTFMLSNRVDDALNLLASLNPNTLTFQQKQRLVQLENEIKERFQSLKDVLINVTSRLSKDDKFNVKLFLTPEDYTSSPFLTFKIKKSNNTLFVRLKPSNNTEYKNQLKICNAQTRECIRTIDFGCNTPSSIENFCHNEQIVNYTTKDLPVGTYFFKAFIKLKEKPIGEVVNDILGNVIRFIGRAVTDTTSTETQEITSSSFTVSGDTSPPVISSVTSSSITSSKATITWTTDELSDSQVEYGYTTSYDAATILDSTLVTSHSQSLPDLSSGALFHYRVKSKDESGNGALSADFNFTTQAGPCEAPVWVDSVTGEPNGTQYKIFYSNTVNSNVSYSIYLPTSYNTTINKYPVLYWLHGGGGNQRTGADFVGWADAQMKAGKIPEMIIVLPRGLSSLWVNSHTNSQYNVPMESIIINDLVPHIDATYRTIGTREARGIEGFSMGGFGSTHLGFRYTELFGVVSDLAGSLTIPLPKGGYVCTFGNNSDYFYTEHPTAIVQPNADKIKGRTYVRIVVGDADNGGGTYQANINFHNLLDSLGIAHNYTVVPGVQHCYTCLYNDLGDSAFTFFKDAFGKVPSTNLYGVAYGTNASEQNFDFYTASTYPDIFVVTMHGGGFEFTGVKEDFTENAKWFASLGYPTANLEYRGTPGYPTQVQDIITALKFLESNYGAKEFILYGHSTGAYLAMLLTLAQNSQPASFGISYPNASIIAAIGTSGSYNFSLLDTAQQNAFLDYANGFENDADVIKYADANDPQILLVAGSNDNVAGSQTSEQLHNAMPTNSEFHLNTEPPFNNHNGVAKPWNAIGPTANYTKAFLEKLQVPIPSDTTDPVISNISVTSITNSSAIITWTTDEAADSLVEYGTTTAYGSSSSLDTSLVNLHTITLTGLSPAMLYHFRVSSKDSSGNIAVSQDFTFVTPLFAQGTPLVGKGLWANVKPHKEFPLQNPNDYFLIRKDPYVLGAYAQFAWAKLEPKEGYYNFTAIDEFMQPWIGDGKRIGLSVGVAVVPGLEKEPTPSWVFDACVAVGSPCKVTGPISGYVYPVYWNA